MVDQVIDQVIGHLMTEPEDSLLILALLIEYENRNVKLI